MIETNDPCFVFGLDLDSEGGGTSIKSDELNQAWVHIDYSHPSAARFLDSLDIQEIVVQ